MVAKREPKRTVVHKLATAVSHPVDTLRKRRARREAAASREHFLELIDELPPVESDTQSLAEVHMLCGSKTWDMGVWASWSMMRFLRQARLYVHSDGTLDEEMVSRWRRAVPCSTFVTRQEADDRVRDELALKYPHLYRWRCGYWAGPQLVDMHLVGRSPLWISMDSDVLCFRWPAELERLIRKGRRCYRYNRDTLGRSNYIATPQVLQSFAGATVPESVNAGFGLTGRFGEADWERLDDVIERLTRDPSIHFTPSFQSNTLYAMAHAGLDAEPLPQSYDVYHGPGHAGQTIRHYVTRVETRSRFFTEGLPDLWAQATSAIKEPASPATRTPELI